MSGDAPTTHAASTIGAVAEAAEAAGSARRFTMPRGSRAPGVDCLMLLAEVYERAGVAAHVEPPFYVPDWHLHRDAERYMEGLLRYARAIAGRP